MIPGIAVGNHPAAPKPLRLLAPGSLLLAGPADHRGHLRHWGPLPSLDLARLIEASATIVGAGGAEFPTARKLHALAQHRVAAVVVNAMEGEPASAKDAMLLLHSPHVVLDGAVAAAGALRVRRVVIRMPDTLVVNAVRAALAQRNDADFEISIGPDRFVAGEASAIARALRGGPALPDGNGRPPMVGVLRRSALLISNAETFARIGVAARGDRRGSSLLTVSGSVGRAGVVELGPQARLRDVLTLAQAELPTMLVTGGWHGAWLPWRPQLADAPLSREGVRAVGGRWGAGVMVVLGRDPDPVMVLDAVADYLAAQTAGQCGPCVHGLPALAAAIHARQDPALLAGQISGRGLCAHPTAAGAALVSAVAAVRSMERQPAS